MHGNLKTRDWTTEDIDLVDKMAQLEARQSFWAFRRYMNPKMHVGWWQREISLELHRFWLEYRAGRRPKLILQSPPQHGKSYTIIDFLSWVVGQQRDLRLIFGSFSDRLGGRANLRLQRIFGSPKYAGVFGPSVLQGGMKQNSKLIEFAGGDGYFRNTTVMGSVTGEGLDIGVIDDPIKGRAEASSKTTREKTWNWMTDDFLTRFADRAGLVMIMTRWHLDDPAGRMMEHYPGVRVLRYPALAEEDEKHVDVDGSPMIRRRGEPLFPELKSLAFLEKQRSVMTLAGWQSVYQQAPIVVGGDLFPIDKVELIPEKPARADVLSSARYWDKAGTSGGGAYSAGVLMLRMRDGTFCVVDVRRGQWRALDRERIIKQTAQTDHQVYPTTKIYVEQEPGSGGKESAENSVRMLAGYTAEADRVTGEKEVRADPFAAQWQAGNVRLVQAEWNRDYLDEHEHFPAGKYKDQVDASSGAFNKIASKYRYDSTLSWVS
jgi:predicted phage terminase large subunit-like protein